MRLEIVREVMRWAPAGSMTAAELVAAAETIEEFVTGSKSASEPRTALEAARNVHTHPTLSEGLQESIHGLAGHMINL